MRLAPTPALALLLAAVPASAQHRHGAGQAHHQPYAGLEGRAVKALPPEHVADLRAGRGMGLALAAELNHHPGPMHVLELAAPLGLDDAQAARTREVERTMRSEAIAAGERLIAAERELDRLFAERIASSASLADATAALGAATGALRLAHLRAHLAMMDILSPDQVERYARLRGYTPATPR